MDTILIERAGPILTVTINRPEKKNAVIPPMWDTLAQTFRAVALDSAVRVVVLTGAGGDFCSGADLWAPPDEEPPHQLLGLRRVNAAVQALHDVPQPTIAKVPGVAAGAGCSLALACDLLVASDAARFTEIFAKRGLSLDAGSSFLLPRRVGLHKAKELAFFGDIIGAAEAERLGLVNKVVPAADLDAAVDEWAQRLAAGPPIALSLTKRLLDTSHAKTMSEALDDEGMAQTINLASEDAAEAFGAFVDKRDPVFRGR